MAYAGIGSSHLVVEQHAGMRFAKVWYILSGSCNAGSSDNWSISNDNHNKWKSESSHLPGFKASEWGVGTSVHNCPPKTGISYFFRYVVCLLLSLFPAVLYTTALLVQSTLTTMTIDEERCLASSQLFSKLDLLHSASSPESCLIIHSKFEWVQWVQWVQW
jgi:hypothetical protein